ncbi:alpha/beta fold hydrolase [Dyadobacter frigoris]|uniref:Alpha/beta fold hydrolase n=1 Tax=Dyadobacter frigoris TaxID=2576211 RepID=A0A4U6D2T2_9BACT|nr:alpha/beta fold hydrolase [Dyadobacter frigoris]TKT91492.1 alpha/beta fold hydrolase [Dyadobacter frigoris]GLU51951.1 alpha/beta hydrolase [Dyadobacter frigoris]
MNLNFKKIGETGPALIILHGVFGFLDNWLTIGKTISEQGFVVYLVDQRHHGRSPHEGSLDFPTLAEDLKEFLEQQNLTSAILLGHSMGGKTVMEYAVRYPDTFEKLVIVDIGPKQYPIHHTKLLQGLNALPVSKIENRQQADDFLSKYEPILAVRQFLLKNLYRKEDGTFDWRFNLPVLTTDMAKVGSPITAKKPVETPTLFIRGEKSNYILDEDWDDILKIFPNAKLDTIADAGHWVQAEQPKVFVEHLLTFLKS